MNKVNLSVVLAFVLCCTVKIALAQDQETELQLPEDLTVKQTDNYVVDEEWVGGRLERFTIKRNAGITEVYRNQRNDGKWFAEESKLGDTQNVRQWRIGSW